MTLKLGAAMRFFQLVKDICQKKIQSLGRRGLLGALVFAAPMPALAASEPLATERLKTVCSITINSRNERELFKKYLPKDGFKFVELIPDDEPGLAFIQGWTGNGWFKKACEKRVQCDVLLISGHFAGTFFGRSGQTLAIGEMEKASCQASCDGIFRRPKEVFLFGCNTLADKTADHRRPEDYVEVMRADGFTADEAQLVALQRYTPWGASNHDRMRSLFPNAVGLYGFSSTSPLGKVIAGPLSQYLKKKAPTYAKDLDQLKIGDRNSALAQAMKGFSFRQADFSVQPPEPLVCRMGLQSNQAEMNLKLMTEQLRSTEPLRELPQILEKMREIGAKQSAVLASWRETVADLRGSLLEKFRAKELEPYFSVRLGLVELLYWMGMDSQQVSQSYFELLNRAARGVGAQRAQEICAQAESPVIRDVSLPKQFANDLLAAVGSRRKHVNPVYEALSCLTLDVDPKWWEDEVPDSFLFSQDWLAQRPLLIRMAQSKGRDNRLRAMVLLLNEEPFSQEAQGFLHQWLGDRESADLLLSTLLSARKFSPSGLSALIHEWNWSQNEKLKNRWIQFWRKVRPTTLALQKQLVEKSLAEADPSVILAVLAGSSLNVELRQEMISLVREVSSRHRRIVLNVLSRLSENGEGLYPLALETLADASPEMRNEAIDLITRFYWETLDPRLEEAMLAILEKETVPDVLDEGLHFWAKRGTDRVDVVRAMFSLWRREREDSNLRETATSVLAHVRIRDSEIITELMTKWNPKQETEFEQVVSILARAQWGTLNVGKDLQSRFEKELGNENSRVQIAAFVALLANTQASDQVIAKASQSLMSFLEDQNWMGARELAFALEPYRAIPVAQKALAKFHQGLDGAE